MLMANHFEGHHLGIYLFAARNFCLTYGHSLMGSYDEWDHLHHAVLPNLWGFCTCKCTWVDEWPWQRLQRGWQTIQQLGIALFFGFCFYLGMGIVDLFAPSSSPTTSVLLSLWSCKVRHNFMSSLHYHLFSNLLAQRQAPPSTCHVLTTIIIEYNTSTISLLHLDWLNNFIHNFLGFCKSHFVGAFWWESLWLQQSQIISSFFWVY